jgi:two-component system OmpR family sensor kinase
MAAEEVERVFERFFRADPSRARASGGVGLGLAIVAAVAEAHGGSVGAASEPGKGATFRVSVPLAPDS